MQKESQSENWLISLGVLALTVAIVVALVFSPRFRFGKSYSAETNPVATSFWGLNILNGAAPDDVEIDEIPAGREYDFYEKVRAKLQSQLEKAQGDADDTLRRELEEKMATTYRFQLFAKDATNQRRSQPILWLAQHYMNRGDLESLSALRKEIEASDWPDREKKSRAFYIRTYQFRTEIAAAIEEKNDEKIESLLPELEAIAKECTGAYASWVASRQNIPDFVNPIAEYSPELGVKAKLMMRRGFFRDGRVVLDANLTPSYPAKPATVPIGDTILSYDQTLLETPQDETTQFYHTRLSELQNLLNRVPSDSSVDAVKELRQKIQNAILDVYERYPLAVELTPREGQVFALIGRTPAAILKESCEKLAEAGEVKRLERLAQRDDYRDVVESYLLQAKTKKALESDAAGDVDAAVDAAVQWALTESDDVVVVKRVEEILTNFKNSGKTQEWNAAKAKFRDAFKNSESRAKRRLIYITALN